MKKVNMGIISLILVALLFGCTKEEKGQLTRVDAQKMNPDGRYSDSVMITDTESVALLRTAFDNVKWSPGTVPNMARKADVKATLFFQFDQNMPERLYHYEIWFNENAGTANIISDHENEGYGELGKEHAIALKSTLMNKLTDWEVRHEYIEGDQLIFRLSPDPELSAGKPYGYLFNFREPFYVYQGKKLAMYAYHQDTGQRVTALSPQVINEPTPGYPTLSRFVTEFELPVGGLWRIEVFLDGRLYGDVIVNVKA
ncbi:MAG: hypothetical protein H0Z33_15685 [Bacillaceae bacterium]|nr:hypothetical protein [Bacillaceae bacterium]